MSREHGPTYHFQVEAHAIAPLTFRWLALLCLLCASLRVLAETTPSLPGPAHYAIQHFGERFGLGSATVLSMAQDGQGFLWIGTETGLYRYDGNGVTHFGRAEGVPSDLVELVLAAPDGSVWVRSRKGIARQVHEHFEAIHLPAEADALRDSFQSFAVTGTEAFSWPRRAACCGCNRIAGAINCSAAEVLQWRARSMLWLGRRTTRSGLRQETGLGAFCREDPNRECRGA